MNVYLYSGGGWLIQFIKIFIKSGLMIVVLTLVVLSQSNCGKKDDAIGKSGSYKEEESPLRHHQRTAEKIDNAAHAETGIKTNDRYSELRKITDSKLRFDGLRKLICDAAARGMLDEAFKMARDGTGPGSDRLLVFGDIFSSSKLPLGDLVELYRKLDDPTERLGASVGLSEPGRFGTSSTNLMDINYKQEDLSAALMMSLTQYAGVSYDLDVPTKIDQERALTVLKIMGNLTKEGKLDEKEMADALSRIGFASPSTAFDYLLENQIDVNKSIISRVIGAKMTESPNETIARMISGGDPGLKDYVNQAFGYWLVKDKDAADVWLNQSKSSLTNEQLESCLSAQAKFYASKGSFDEARKAIDTIGDPVQKKLIEGQVWTTERDSLRKEVGIDPAGAVQSIISGQSKHPVYWIEEAMGTWIAKDPAKAEEWYQSNWKSLPANKSQYVAAAYANEALKQGDSASASQWATYIKDPKTKQRIQDGINKAAANATN